jgi:hypothetical protein
MRWTSTPTCVLSLGVRLTLLCPQASWKTRQMAQVLQDVRKRALADVSNAKSRPCKAGRPAEDSKPLTADTAAAQAAMAPGAVQSSSSAVSGTDVQAAKAVSQATQSNGEEASETVPTCPGSPASDASCDTECDSPAEPDRCTSPSPPPCQAEQQSAYLLLKACEREDAAEERADAAEAALAEANRKLAATEAALAAAQTRLQLLEVGAPAALPACRYHDHAMYLQACSTAGASQHDTPPHAFWLARGYGDVDLQLQTRSEMHHFRGNRCSCSIGRSLPPSWMRAAWQTRPPCPIPRAPRCAAACAACPTHQRVSSVTCVAA